ncbi:MAG: hypothetical protein ACNA7J_07555 [Wenzhouxiangella sp.]
MKKTFLVLCCAALILLAVMDVGFGDRSGEASRGLDEGRWDPEIRARFQEVDAARAAEKGCLSCHEGIEVISESMQPTLLAMAGGREGFECAVCHEGQPDATTKDAAHANMWPNPSSMWVMSEGGGCAKCHSDTNALTTVMGKPLEDGPTGGQMMPWRSTFSDPSGATGANHVYRVQRSLMALETGKANKTLSSNGAIPKGTFPYANFDMDDPEGAVPSAGTEAYKEWIAKAIEEEFIVRLDSVEAIPTYHAGLEIFGDPGHAALADMHRKQCARCHVWGEGRTRRGDHRAGGCAACHTSYTNDALYEGNDPTIPKDRGPHMKTHQITSAVSSAQCTHCHTRGKRIGTTFAGMVEHTYVGSGEAPPFDPHGNPQNSLYTKEYNHTRADIHKERGMDCADCHSSIDVHGDGNIYPVTYYQVEIGCADCHGTPDRFPWELPVGYGSPVTLEGERGTYTSGQTEHLITSRGNPRTRWVREGDRAFVESLYTGKRHEVPLLREKEINNSWKTEQGRVAMSVINQHMETMECYACHAVTAPQCYGCHIKYDMTVEGIDWALSAMNYDPHTGKQTLTTSPGDIVIENVGYIRWENPILAVNFRDKVTPVVPGCQVVWTMVDENGVLIDSNRIFETTDGFKSPTLAPLNPHATSAVARTCESCHSDPKAIGYGYAKSRSAAQVEGDAPMVANQGPGLFGDIPDSERAEPLIPAIPDFPWSWEQLVTRSGKQIQNMPLPQDRPLSDEQRAKAEREGTCIACHQHYDTETWDRVRIRMRDQLGLKDGRALTPDEHDRAVEAALLSLGAD